MQIEALLRTEFGEAYLEKLCLHFARRVPVSIVGRQGVIEFSFGRCRIDVDDNRMRLHVDLNDAERASHAERLLTEHLLRILQGEDDPRMHWSRTLEGNDERQAERRSGWAMDLDRP